VFFAAPSLIRPTATAASLWTGMIIALLMLLLGLTCYLVFLLRDVSRRTRPVEPCRSTIDGCAHRHALPSPRPATCPKASLDSIGPACGLHYFHDQRARWLTCSWRVAPGTTCPKTHATDPLTLPPASDANTVGLRHRKAPSAALFAVCLAAAPTCSDARLIRAVYPSLGDQAATAL
jgi:hypothetical protein